MRSAVAAARSTPGRGARRRGASAWAALVALPLLASACSPAADGSGESSEPTPAPRSAALELEQLVPQIAPASLEVPLVVNFWATWCAPCVAELPALAEVAREHAGEVRVLCVSMDLAVPANPAVESVDDVYAFFEERGHGLTTLVYDGEAEDLNAALDLPGPIPFTYVLDRGGERVAAHEGMLSKAEFEEMLAPVLR